MIFTSMQRSEIRECAEVAAQAFFDYEYFTNYFPNDAERIDFLRKVITSEYRTNFGKADYLVGKEDGKIVAVADLRSPNYKKPSDLSYMLHGWLKVVMIRPSEPVNAWLKMDAEAGEFCHQQQDETMWYLSSLTIHPDYQGKGIGTKMLTDGIMPYMREHGATRMCFFTNSEKNLKFYTGLGFEVKDKRDFTYNGHTMGSWSFVREL